MMDQWKKTQRNLELQKKLEKAPVAFLHWVDERKASVSDLMPLNSLPDLNEVGLLLEKFPQQQLTRSQGRQVIDLLADLLLMKVPMTQLKPISTSWQKQLHQLRYPNTTARDQEASFEQLNWPKFAKVQKQRSGDRLNYQMTIQFQNLEELQDKLKRLAKNLEEQ